MKARGRDYLLRSSGRRVVDEDPAAGTVASVSDLTRRIKEWLEESFPPLWVRGEISNLRVQASGHAYFSLKDAGSQIPCVMFRGDVARLNAPGAFRDGAQVLAFAEVSVYEPRGYYQLIVRVVVDHGQGRLQLELEKLKQRLAAEGLFDAGRKRPLPLLPSCIGLVTSPTGAALQDFLRILKRRHWLGRLVVLPVKVQGDEAAGEMVRALALAQELEQTVPFDLLVVGRGGGSLEDLWAFNDETLARAIAACRLPVISAVGHEIDFVLSDLAADVRAETPSAAAELISSGYLDAARRVRDAAESLDGVASQLLRDWRSRLEIVRSRLAAVSPTARLEQGQLRLDDLANRLLAAGRRTISRERETLGSLAIRLGGLSPRPRLVVARERLAALARRLPRETAVVLDHKRKSVARCRERLTAVGPESVLRRGYVIVRDASGKPVLSSRDVRQGVKLSGQWRDGSADLEGA